MENGEKPISKATAKQLAEIFDVSGVRLYEKYPHICFVRVSAESCLNPLIAYLYV